MSSVKYFKGVIKDAQRVNLTEAALPLFTTRTEWVSVLNPTHDDRAAVYFLRPATRTDSIHRWLSMDERRILYIGRTTRRNGIRQRSEELANGTHQVTRRLANPFNRIAWVGGAPLALEYSYVPVKDNDHGRLWEGLCLLAYYRHFGEVPPANRRLEYIRAGRKKTDIKWNEFLKAFEGIRCLEWMTIQGHL